MKPFVMRTIRTTGLLLFCGIALANVALPYLYWRAKLVPDPGPHDAGMVQGDFSLRWCEAECVRKGIDPYDIWSGKTNSDEYYPYNRPELKSPAATKKINAYPPWEYAWMIPFTFMPLRTAWRCFDILMVSLVMAIFGIGFLKGYGARRQFRYALFVGCAAICVGYAAERIFIYGNYGVFLSFAVFVLAASLERGRNVLAGFCLGFLMAKPQVGILFSIPLLISKRWKSVLVAVSFCMVSTVPVSILVNKSPMELVLQIPRYGSDVITGTLLFPEPLFARIAEHTGIIATAAINAAIGILICISLSSVFRQSKQWLVRLSPATLICTAWTYCIFHDRWVYSSLNIIFALIFLSPQFPTWHRMLSLIAILINESTAVLSVVDRMPVLCKRLAISRTIELERVVSNSSLFLQSANVVLMAAILLFAVWLERRKQDLLRPAFHQG